MKNFTFFSLAFVFISLISFGISKAKLEDKFSDSLLTGFLGATVTAIVFTTMTEVEDKAEENWINKTQNKLKQLMGKTQPKLLAPSPNMFLLPPSGDLLSPNKELR
jgi:hypothetical protein